jgi:hypothetical protein
MNSKIIAIAKYVLSSFTFFCCDEELPPRNNPQNLLQCTMQVVYNGAPNPKRGFPLKNAILILITLKSNYYDETIQGHGDFTGKLEIIWPSSPQRRKTVTLDKSLLTDNRRYKYDAETNIVTMDPGDEASFYYEWDWKLDGGDTLTNFFPMNVDDDCVRYEYDKRGHPIYYWYPRRVSEQSIIVKGQIRLFKELATVYAESRVYWFLYETLPEELCQRADGGLRRP